MLQSLILTTPQTGLKPRLALAATHSLLDPHVFSPDLHLAHDPAAASVTIKQTRAIKSFLTTTPLVGDHKVVIVPFAENLTIPAQNSLLKTLEEPPDFSQIILITSTADRLLSTIVSRCQTIFSQSSTTKPTPSTDLEDLLALPPFHRLPFADRADARSATTLAAAAIDHFRQLLKAQPTNHHLYNLTLSLYCHKLLSQNVNPKLALDYLLLNLK